jgi:hypothetical protein
MSKKLPTWLVVIGHTLLALEHLMVLYALCELLLSFTAEVLDIPTVRHVAMERGKPALVAWIDEHEREYRLGLLNAFLAAD